MASNDPNSDIKSFTLSKACPRGNRDFGRTQPQGEYAPFYGSQMIGPGGVLSQTGNSAARIVRFSQIPEQRSCLESLSTGPQTGLVIQARGMTSAKRPLSRRPKVASLRGGSLGARSHSSPGSAVLDMRKSNDTTVGPAKPLGSRRAHIADTVGQGIEKS